MSVLVLAPAANERGPSQGDAAIVARARQDRLAFGELFDRHYLRIYRYALSRLPEGQVADAEDITSEVFLAALVDLPRYQEREGVPFTAWLYAITRYRLADELKSRRRRYSLVPTDTRAIGSSEQRPEEQALTNLELEHVLALVATLPELERTVTELRFRADQPTDRIAELLNTTPERVRRILERARLTLRRALNGEADPRCDRQLLEERRMWAADLFEQGRGPSAVARELGVSTANVGQWYRAWKAGGAAALQTKTASVREGRRMRAEAAAISPGVARHRGEHRPAAACYTQARALLAAASDRVPSVEEVAARLGIDLDYARRLRDEVLRAERAPAPDRVLVVLTLLEAASASPVHVGRILSVLADMPRSTLFRALNSLLSSGRAVRVKYGYWRATNPASADEARAA